MPYWLKHNDHGLMPVYDTGAVENAAKHGWTLLNQGEEPLKQIKPSEQIQVPTVDLVEKRRPGRPRKVI